ncbi:NADH-quinone oxidoreductase subunit J (modular protein) [Candidatus Xenohaliotis californiensis]|uniref:NADH-quinone oxidoreductase subunit J n=2 Tax=Candidatus Xenohaliotis californiensis TaxID=84677 RepID=A0ABP0EWE4_9RICK|nr:NADH-quinone oxidoreductase subunit J (modular protein) [Candidatus Xenohaliotis californiensis]
MHTNPVNSIFSLIGVFIAAACLMIAIGIEFYAFTLLIIYVGAVAILFLFLVTLSNAKDKVLRSFIPLLFCAMPVLLLLWKFLNIFHLTKRSWSTASETSTAHIGYAMFTKYFLPLQLVGVLLLLSMCATVALVLEKSKRKDQLVALETRKVVLIDKKFGEGVDCDC